jgi:mevalonate kinase
MQVIASAPGKAILFGEHAVVYGKPAIAIAIDKRAYTKVIERSDDKINVNVRNIGLSGSFDIIKSEMGSENVEKGIFKYIFESLRKIHDGSGVDISVDLNIPIGAGLGSSAAVTVATIAAISKYNDKDLSKVQIAKYAHEVEVKVQKAASPLDTTISTYGGIIYLSSNAEKIIPLELDWKIPLVIGYTKKSGNTGTLVKSVRIKKQVYPEIINYLMDSIGIITKKAMQALLNEDKNQIGDLMNLNHGILDALGVNTKELSDMVYLARNAGALGSKITGAGGGGSVIAYCPNKINEVISMLNATKNTFEVKISKKGVEWIF